MSNREGREICLDCSWFPSGHIGGMADRAAHAEREARAILAKTEGESNSLLVCVERLRPAVCAPNVWTTALAESLAAFETMTVEQLAKLQEV